jgi:hypothetical protein
LHKDGRHFFFSSKDNTTIPIHKPKITVNLKAKYGLSKDSLYISKYSLINPSTKTLYAQRSNTAYTSSLKMFRRFADYSTSKEKQLAQSLLNPWNLYKMEKSRYAVEEGSTKFKKQLDEYKKAVRRLRVIKRSKSFQYFAY